MRWEKKAKKYYALLADAQNRRNTERKIPWQACEPEKRLEAEGHTVIQKRKSKNFIVKDFEKALLNI